MEKFQVKFVKRHSSMLDDLLFYIYFPVKLFKNHRFMCCG